MFLNYRTFFIISFLFVLLTANFSCTSRKQLNYLVTEKKYSPAELIKDVDYSYDLLTKGHPGVYWYITKEKLDFKFDSLKQSLTVPLTTQEFYRKLAPLVADIKCGHTRLILVTKKSSKKEKDSIAKIGKPINQFAYKVLNDKLYIKSFNKRITQVKKGDEVLKIAGEPVSKIFSDLENNYASDGYNTTFKQALLDRGFIGWYEAVKNSNDTLDFTIKKKDTTINLTLTTTRPEKKLVSNKVKKEDVKINKDSLNATKKIAKEKLKVRYKGFDENKKPILDLQFLEKDSSIAYLKVKSFSFPHANFTRFFDESFTEIKKAKTNDLIIDLRNNGGGSLAACRNLFSYLVNRDFVYLKEGELTRKFNPYWHAKGLGNALKALPFELVNLIRIKKREDKYYINFKGTKPLHANEKHFDGKVYVLINGYSFSASALLSANLKQINRATFVGQETGGAFNGCVAGQIPILNLPNSRLKLRMGLYPVIPNAHTETIGRGIFPDQKINTTIEDFIAGKDNELNWVLKDIKKKI